MSANNRELQSGVLKIDGLKVLFDNNVILDSLLQRENLHQEPDKLFHMVVDGDISGYLCASSVTTLYYLMQRHVNKAFAEQHISLLLNLFEVAPVNKTILMQAKDVGGRDFEDAVLFMSAHALGLDAIVTRNIKDFSASPVAVYSPSAILAMMQDKM